MTALRTRYPAQGYRSGARQYGGLPRRLSPGVPVAPRPMGPAHVVPFPRPYIQPPRPPGALAMAGRAVGFAASAGARLIGPVGVALTVWQLYDLWRQWEDSRNEPDPASTTGPGAEVWEVNDYWWELIPPGSDPGGITPNNTANVGQPISGTFTDWVSGNPYATYRPDPWPNWNPVAPGSTHMSFRDHFNTVEYPENVPSARYLVQFNVNAQYARRYDLGQPNFAPEAVPELVPGTAPLLFPQTQFQPQIREVGNSAPETVAEPATAQQPAQARARARARRPPRGTKESKVRFLRGAGFAMWAISQVTEALDFLDALYDALPEDLQIEAWVQNGRRNLHPVDKATHLWENLDQMDVGQALENIVWEQVEDYAWGRFGQLMGEAARVFPFDRVAGFEYGLSRNTRWNDTAARWEIEDHHQWE